MNSNPLNKRKEADYYAMAGAASKQVQGHYGLEQLQKIADDSKKIIDVGCGEGTRLNVLVPTRFATGIDVNKIAIKRAKKKYPKKDFKLATAENLPFQTNTFDLVYSAFVLEHTLNPEAVLLEMVRICKTGGKIIIICPNFGAPNRRSPNSIQNPIPKLIQGVYRDFYPHTASKLNWTKVNPKPKYYQSDDDTTVEPYIYSLIRFLKAHACLVIDHSSLWSLEQKSSNPRKIIFKILGKLNIFPFANWGPQIYIHAKKIR